MQTGLPDVSQVSSHIDWGAPLKWVGMSHIEMPVKWLSMILPSAVDFQVNLKSTNARGIHMSRLYKLLAESLPERDLNFSLLEALAKQALETHKELSDRSSIKVHVNLPVERKALISGLKGWRQYPVTLSVEAGEIDVKSFVEISVLYSSTCPASTALAARANGEGQDATPHSQRSRAEIKIELKPASLRELQGTEFINSLIDCVEDSLGTPVQTAVRREDEQRFAVLNAQNLMFCEDAARRIHKALEQRNEVAAFQGQVVHYESLHPHNAVAAFSS